MSSYTGGTMPETSSDYSSRKQTADYISRQQTAQHAEHWTTYGNGRPNHDTNGRPPKVYIHSGNVGNAIPGSEKSAESARS